MAKATKKQVKVEKKQVKTIGVLTSGGDAPGMNAAIRAVVRTALANGLKVKGIRRGYTGLLEEDIVDMNAKSVADIIQRGGTVLYTARCPEMMTADGQDKAADVCKKHGIDGLVVIGGDGSFQGARQLAARGINTVGVPGTIDLDIACTEYTIGFDTAVNTAMEAIDKVRDTSTSHERCSIIEVMGRRAGYIALWCGIANGAEDILTVERYDNDEQKIIDNIKAKRKIGKTHHIIINAEGIGDSHNMAKRIEAATGMETRATVIGHIQRGGSPTCKDRVYASSMGAKAVDILTQGGSNRVVAYRHGEFVDFDIEEALAMKKTLDPYMCDMAKKLSR
ncbi:MAG: 6-phosphofructokinase [Lachnospiraceae bacterium]|nr:6-phosphofructokinase [Lachnospiraceae bacterium]